MIWRQNQIGTVAKQSECGRPGRGNARRWQPVGNHGPIREDIEVVTSAALSGFGIFDGRFTQGGASLALGYPLSGFQPFWISGNSCNSRRGDSTGHRCARDGRTPASA